MADHFIQGDAGDNTLTGVGTAGDVDHIAGLAGDDDLIPRGASQNYLLGGDGNDAFIIKAKDLDAGAHDTIYDFGGAGGWIAGNNDFLALTGFGAGSSITSVVDSTKVDGLAYYTVHSTTFNEDFVISIASTNGQHLAAGDFAFYG
jgi:hypothetical protein